MRMLFDIQRFTSTRFGTTGNDSIVNYTDDIVVYGFEGDDDIHNWGDNVTISAGSGEDTVGNFGENVSISGGADYDTIFNYSDNVTIDSSDGNDYIASGGSNVSISGGEGDDDILVAASLSSDNSVSGGAGNDTIINVTLGTNVNIDAGDGDDVIGNYGDNVTMLGGAGDDTIYNSSLGTDIKMDAGDGDDTLENHGENVTIIGGEGNDVIKNTGYNVTITGGAGKDSIYNDYSNSVTMDGGAGNDTLNNYWGYYLIMDGGSGADSIINRAGDYTTIDGGAGNDYISIASNSDYNVIHYSNGSDNDTVYGFDSNDTLKISSNSYSTTTSGDDILVNVDSGSILLVGAASISPNIEQPNDYTLFLESNQSENIWLSGWDYFNSANVWGNDTLSNIDSSNNGYAHILAGNNLSNQIVAGSGSTSMWGGNGGNDTMIGGSSRDYFVYVNGNGNDFAKNFKAGSSGDSDIVALQGDLGTIEREGNTVTVNGSSGGSLIIETDFSTDEAILYTIDGTNIGAAKLADSTNTLYYDKNVYHFRFNDNAGRLFYWGNEDVTIALDNSTAQDYVGLKTIITKSDTEKASGNLTIIGNDLDNEIYSGAGNDMLTGGSGADTFYWGSGDGYDIITDAESSDVINLYNVSLSDISSTSVSDNKLDLRLNDGSHLDAYYGTQATFQFSDGTRYKYENNNWQQQS